MRLTASLPGDTDRVFDGVFSNGILFEGAPLGLPLEMLPTDDYLIDLSERLPADYPGQTVWLREKLDDAWVNLRPSDAPQLLVVVHDDFPAHDESAVATISRKALSIAMELCPVNADAQATVNIIPLEHQRVFDGGALKFEPRQVQITLSDLGGEPSTWSVDVRILSADIEAKRLRLEEEAERQAKRQQQERAAAMRGTLDVRGVRLDMNLAEVHALFEDEIESWEPEWDPSWKMPVFNGFKIDFQLRDKTHIAAQFTSAQNNSKLFAFGYRQTLRDGPTVEALRQDLEAKYGPPDEVHSHGQRMTWFLPSKRDGATGASLNASYKVDEKTGLVSQFDIGMSDWDLGRYDESAAYASRLKAEQQAALKKEEGNESNVVKF